MRGTFFVVGEVAERAPELVREVAAPGHEVGLHGWRHVPLTAPHARQLRADVERGQGAARGPQRRAGRRLPRTDVLARPESRWAVDVLAEVGFTYSSSVLPARSPLFGDPAAPGRPVPLAERAGRAAVPRRAHRRRRVPLPRRRATSARCRRRCRAAAAPPVRRRPDALDLLPPLRLRRRRAVLGGARGRALRQPAALVQPPAHVRQGRRAAARPAWPRRSPNASPRSAAAPRPLGVAAPCTSTDDFSQLEMVHRLPPADARRPVRVPRASSARAVASCTSGSPTPAAPTRTPRPARGSTRTSRRGRASSSVSTSTPTGVEHARARATTRTRSTAATPTAVRALGLAPADVVVAGEVIEHLDDCRPLPRRAARAARATTECSR